MPALVETAAAFVAYALSTPINDVLSWPVDVIARRWGLARTVLDGKPPED